MVNLVYTKINKIVGYETTTHMLYEFKNFLYSLHNATICKGYKYENNMTLITCSRVYHMSICLHVTRYMTT